MPNPAPSSPSLPRRVRFDTIEVDFVARRLLRNGSSVRLQEKPFLLLEALLERVGTTVSRESLQQRLWPDATHLDFDAGLNVAVRKLRRALADSASQPRWLFTSTGEGYRLEADVAEVPFELPAQPSDRPRIHFWRTRLILWVIALAAIRLLLGFVVGSTSNDKTESVAPSRNRIAIMPFELSSPDHPPDLARVSEWLVADLARLGITVIGPRSTASYSEFPFPNLQAMADDLGADFVLNARSVGEGPQPSLVVELIDLEDHSHPWVHFFEPPWQWPTIALEVCHGVSSVLPMQESATCTPPPTLEAGPMGSL